MGGGKWAYSYFVGIIKNQCKVLEGNLRKNLNITYAINIYSWILLWIIPKPDKYTKRSSKGVIKIITPLFTMVKKELLTPKFLTIYWIQCSY